MKFLWASSSPSYSLVSKKPITKLDDFKGMKIAITGDRFTKMLSAIGAVPLPTTLADRGTALQTGMLDGSIIPNDLTYPYRLHQSAPYYMDMDWGALSSVNIAMNLELFKSLPADVQNIVQRSFREVAQRNAPLYFYNESRLVRLMAQEKVTINPSLSLDEKVKWSNLLGEPVAERVKRGEDLGLPNKAMATRYMELLNKAGWKFPKQWSVQ